MRRGVSCARRRKGRKDGVAVSGTRRPAQEFHLLGPLAALAPVTRNSVPSSCTRIYFRIARWAYIPVRWLSGSSNVAAFSFVFFLIFSPFSFFFFFYRCEYGIQEPQSSANHERFFLTRFFFLSVSAQ